MRDGMLHVREEAKRKREMKTQRNDDCYTKCQLCIGNFTIMLIISI
jgi:hypothetical protein